MASTTWVGGSSGNETDWATGANWSTGSVPTTSAHVVIPNTTHNCALDQSRTIGSLTIESGGTIVGGGFTLFIQSEGDAAGGTEHFAVNNDGIISGELNLNITTPATTSCDFAGSTGNFHDVTINHASCQVNSENSCTLTGDLTITKGKFDVNGNSLSVAGTITVNSVAGGDAELDIGDVVADCAKIAVESGDTITAAHSSNALTVDGNGISTGRSIDFTGIISGTLDIICTHPNTTEADLSASSGVINHLTLNHASLVMKMNSSATLANLTITAGEFSTVDNGGTSKDLTVTANTVVNGTLTGNNSTLTFGTNGVHGSTEGGCLLVNSGGTFTFGSGDVTVFSGFTAKGTDTVTSTGGGDILIKGRTNNGFMNSHGHKGVNITGDYIIDYDNNAIFDNRGGVTITCGTFKIIHGGRTYEPWSNTGQDLFKIVGDMEISGGTFDTQYVGQDSQHLTVTGDVSVTGTLTGNASAISLGSLTIASAGTYSATSGTTTITSEAGSGYAVEFSGTYTHNSGTLKITTDANTFVKTNDKTYNLVIEPTTATRVYEYVNNTTIHGNLTVNAGRFTHYSSSYSLDVQGDCTVNDTGILDGGSGSIELGSLAVNTGGEYRATSGTTTITKYASNAKAIYANGPISHNGGTFAFTNTDDYGSIAIQLEGGAGSAGAQFNDVTFSGNSTYRFPYYGMGAGITVSGDVTISDTVEVKQWRRDMVISGNLTINSGCEYDCDGSGVAGVSSEFTAGSLTISAGGTFSPSPENNTITTGAFDITTNSFDLGANTLNFTGTNASFLSATNATFSAGPGATITGKAADDKTDFDCQKNFQVVGDVSNLNNNGPGSLMVTGQVINCDGNIIQLKPTQDSEQQLDKSSEADRETTLGRDLDGNTELVG